jgi:membrane protease YdiL (CAAX protease family)
MENIISPTIRQRKHRLLMSFLVMILCYHLVSISSLFIYSPRKASVPPLLTLLYTSIQTEHTQLINSFIDNSPMLSAIKHSAVSRSITLFFSYCVFLVISMIFFKKNTIKFYMPRMKTAKNVTMREKLLVTIIIISIQLYIIVVSLYSSAQQVLPQFPPFTPAYTIFWFCYIFADCFFGPYTEELLFRGLFLDEIKECYKLSPRSVILCQAAAFYSFHVICSGRYAPYLFLIGIITGIFCFYTNSLLYGLIFHVCNNIVANLLITGVINANRIRISGSVTALLSIIFISFTFICFFLFIKNMKKVLFL